MIISVVNTKGGVGKTTTAIMLGCALGATGRMIEVLDADPQGSASMWARRAKEAGEGLPFAVGPVNVATIPERNAGGDRVIIIDTPPGPSPTTDAAVGVSDLIIIPTDASLLDMDRTWTTLRAAAGTARVVLLTKAEPATILYRAAREALENEPDVVLLNTFIPKRQATKAAAGTNPTDLDSYTALATEVMELAA